jgi:hypothetical protein
VLPLLSLPNKPWKNFLGSEGKTRAGREPSPLPLPAPLLAPLVAPVPVLVAAVAVLTNQHTVCWSAGNRGARDSHREREYGPVKASDTTPTAACTDPALPGDTMPRAHGAPTADADDDIARDPREVVSSRSRST